MEIISHRGYWKVESEKNKNIAFDRSFKLGFGTETDLRDYNGELVISHDIANSSSILIDDFLKNYKSIKTDLTLALNIKSDGLQLKLLQALKKYNVTNYFVFDMSIPDSIGYIKNHFNVFTRVSEYENSPAFYKDIKGIWLDSFKSIWYSKEMILEQLNKGKKVAIVSNELHKRDKFILWNQLRKWNLDKENNIILCTDFPEEAKIFFKDE